MLLFLYVCLVYPVVVSSFLCASFASRFLEARTNASRRIERPAVQVRPRTEEGFEL